jgi:D-tyrosyl-tRNA(Tyr) deacylase
MIALIQRVSSAHVIVDGNTTGEISYGILALIGIEKEDNQQKIEKLTQKILNYRIFSDDKGNMNNSLMQTQGGLLLVPQFTLAADTNSGLRPSFSKAAPPAYAKQLFLDLVSYSKVIYNKIETGIFGADMKVSLLNDGPVTFWLQV